MLVSYDAVADHSAKSCASLENQFGTETWRGLGLLEPQGS